MTVGILNSKDPNGNFGTKCLPDNAGISSSFSHCCSFGNLSRYCLHMSLSQKTRGSVSLQCSIKHVQACRHYITGTRSTNQDKVSFNFPRDKKILPDSDPPSGDDVNLLYQFIDHRSLSLFTFFFFSSVLHSYCFSFFLH